MFCFGKLLVLRFIQTGTIFISWSTQPGACLISNTLEVSLFHTKANKPRCQQRQRISQGSVFRIQEARASISLYILREKKKLTSRPFCDKATLPFIQSFLLGHIFGNFRMLDRECEHESISIFSGPLGAEKPKKNALTRRCDLQFHCTCARNRSADGT